MEYISLKTAPMGTEESERGPKIRQTKEAGCKGKCFFLTEEEKTQDRFKRDVERDGGEAWWRQNLCHLFKKQVYLHARPRPPLPLLSNYGTGCERGSNKPRRLIHFLSSSYSLRRERKRRSERQPHWETGEEGREKKNRITYFFLLPSLGGYVGA